MKINNSKKQQHRYLISLQITLSVPLKALVQLTLTSPDLDNGLQVYAEDKT